MRRAISRCEPWRVLQGTVLRGLLLLLAVALPHAEAGAAEAAAPKRLVAYYVYQDGKQGPEYTARQIPFKKLTHLIQVGLLADAAGDGTVRLAPHAVEPVLIPRAHRAGVHVLVCVQGPADAFRKAASNAEARGHFVASVKSFVALNSYDGVDIDWEVPENPVDVADNVLLMHDLREALPRPKYLLSMATPSEPGHWGQFDFAQLNSYVDFYNVMTYDFHGPWTNHAGHNSPLFLSDADPGHDGSIDDSVNLYLNKLGVPPEKINLGTGFYGYEFPVGQLHGSCQCEKTTASRGYGSYVKARIGNDGWVREFDSVAMAPYLIRGAPTPGFITYDDAESTARKVTYALGVRDLGGVFMWELSEDYDGRKQDLLDSMYRSFKKMNKRP